jgi:hypothetical protein
MEQTNSSALVGMPAAGQKNKKRGKGVVALLFSILAIMFCLFFVGPQLEKLPLFQPIIHFIDERGIEANMYFYTDLEEFSEAHINMDNSMDYPPQGPQ